jgi:hypothetical protein
MAALALAGALALLGLHYFSSAVTLARQFSVPGSAEIASRRLEHVRPLSTNGPLRVSAANPRYFADKDGNIIYLVGAHTWTNLQDGGGSFPPPAFDYNAYLDFLDNLNHNFFRLWMWEQPRWSMETADDNYWIDPLPFVRTGPGLAADGRPKFDLTKFNDAYFERMRERILLAKQRGFYVSVMLFNGWSVRKGVPGFRLNNPWRSHPFNKVNNINGIDGDPDGDNSGEESHRLIVPAVTKLQEAYVRKVIDTVADLDNVLYEISNESEGPSWQWQYHIINFIKSYESTRLLQHPVGMTFEWPGGENKDLFASPADWISPNGSVKERPVADGRKVIVADTDHLCGKCGNRAWVWKSFLMGENLLFMDGYDGSAYGQGATGFRVGAQVWASLRANMGYTLTYASRVKLARMRPRPDLASTGYALADARPGGEYIVYLARGGSVVVDVSSTPGALHVEWLNPGTGHVVKASIATGGAVRSFSAPFTGDAVLYLRSQAAR